MKKGCARASLPAHWPTEKNDLEKNLHKQNTDIINYDFKNDI